MARLVCLVQPTPAGVSVTWSDGPAAFAPYELPARPLAAAADAARAALGAVVEGSFDGADSDPAAAAAGLAAAGYGLYQALFKPPAEQLAQAAEVRKWLDALQAEGAVEALEVVADGGVAVPWNLVYDRRPDPAAFKAGGDDPVRWRPFWGLRYDLAGGRRVSPLRRLPVLHNPRVVVVTDPLVLDRLADESRALAALCAEHGWVTARSRQELAAAVAGGRPDLLYWLGHTQADPFGLVLGDDVITPDDLKGLLEGDPFDDPGRVFGGVAFLNACGTAVAEKSGSFLDALHPLGLTGYVATEQVTVDTFAAPVGREFLTGFVVRGEPLGRVMRQLRGRVPLGLLYGSYCPPTVRVRRDGAGPADAAPIVLTHSAPGVKLRREAGAAAEAYPLPPRPYRSLHAYGPADRALFAGRDDDTLRFCQLLDAPGTRLVLLHGESGVGKTSFLQAGVVPFLERECVGYRFARDRLNGDGETVLVVRATNDPVGQVAGALAAFCARPLAFRTPAGTDAEADLPGVLAAAVGEHADLRAALRADPGLLGRVLADLGRRLPFTPVLVIDQAEEVFTLARTPADEANRAAALEMLRRAAAGAGGFKVVVSLRTEYHGRFADKLRQGTDPAAGLRDYLLTDFGTEELTRVILRPTSAEPVEHAAEVPAEKYRFRYAPGVAEEVARRARAYSVNRADSVLPLVQVVCTQLYDRVRGRRGRTVTAADLAAIGGVEGGMRAHAEALVARLFPRRADQAAFRTLLADPRTQLFVRQADGTLTTALLPAEFLARHWTGRTPFDEVLRAAGAGEWRLLRVNSLRIGGDAEERPYVSLGHDALAKVAARWQDELRRQARNRWYAAALAMCVAVAVGLSGLAAGLAVLTAWALTQRRDAEEARDRAERERYVAVVRSAGLAWDRGRPDEAAALLDAYHPAVNPAAHAKGHPGFEWNHLWRRTRLAAPVLRGHSGTPEVALSPDGTRLASIGEENTARVWEVPAGRLVWAREDALTFTSPRSLAFSPDGKRVACGNLTGPGFGRSLLGGLAAVTDGTEVWDAATGEPLGVDAGGRYNWGPQCDPAGKLGLVPAEGPGIRVVELATGNVRQTFPHGGPDAGRAFSPDGSRVVICAPNEPIVVRGVGANRTGFVVDCPGATAGFSPDGAALLVAAPAVATVHDAGTGRPLGPPIPPPPGRAFAAARFSADGSRLLAALVDAGARPADPPVTGLYTRPVRGGPAAVTDLRGRGPVAAHAFSAAGDVAVAAGDDGLRVLDPIVGAERQVLPGGRGGGPVYLTADGGRVVRGLPDGTVRVWDTGAADPEASRSLGGGRVAAVSSDRERVVLLTADGADVVEARTGRRLAALRGHSGPVTTADFGRDGGRVVTAADHAVRVWDAHTGAGLARIDLAADEWAAAAVISPDGRAVAALTRRRPAGADDKDRVRVWEAGSGNPVCTLRGPDGFCEQLAFTADGSGLVTLDSAEAVLWDAATGERRSTLVHAHAGDDRAELRSFAFDADRARLLVVDSRTTRVLKADGWAVVREWPVRSGAAGVFGPDGRRVVVLAAPAGGVGERTAAVHVCDLGGGSAAGTNGPSVRLSPDAQRLSAAAEGRGFRFWDRGPADGGRGVFTFPGRVPARAAVAVSPDGTRLLTAAPETGVQLWDLRTAAELLTLAPPARGRDEPAAAWFSANGHWAFAALGDRFHTWDGRPVGP